MAAKKSASKGSMKKASAKKSVPKKAAAKRSVSKKAAAKKSEPSTHAAPRKAAKAASNPNGDWRGETMARIRRLIKEAVPDVVEERKWRKPTNPDGVPTWSHDGIICTGETYKNYVKLTFAKGASLPDPSRLFNASLDAGTRRAIDIREGDAIDEQALKSLVRAAAAMNEA